MDELSTFASRLRTAREALGISQRTLGIRSGMDPLVASARINQYERGRHSPDQHIALRLAKALGVPVSFLYEPDPDLADLIRVAGTLKRRALRALIRAATIEVGLKPASRGKTGSGGAVD